MLLITGTQRCGSSLMAEFVRQCGYPIQGDSDEVGAHDDENIALAYRRILGDPSFPWSNYPVTKPMDQVPWLRELDYEVAKFPFLMMHPQIMRIWLNERGSQDKFLILVREAEKVIWSKKNTRAREIQFETDSPMIPRTATILKQNWFDSFMLLMNNSKAQFRFLKFPNFLTDYDSVFNTLRLWGGLSKIPTNDGLWKSIVDHEKVTAG